MLAINLLKGKYHDVFTQEDMHGSNDSMRKAFEKMLEEDIQTVCPKYADGFGTAALSTMLMSIYTAMDLSNMLEAILLIDKSYNNVDYQYKLLVEGHFDRSDFYHKEE